MLLLWNARHKCVNGIPERGDVDNKSFYSIRYQMHDYYVNSFVVTSASGFGLSPVFDVYLLYIRIVRETHSVYVQHTHFFFILVLRPFHL